MPTVGAGRQVDSFNGAAVVRPRRSFTQWREASALIGFNGAAVVRPRRYRRHGDNGKYYTLLQRSRGRETAEMVMGLEVADY